MTISNNYFTIRINKIYTIFLTHPWLRIILYAFFISLCLYKYSKTFFYTSDGAIFAITGETIAKGNILLKGWNLSTMPFYFPDQILAGIISLFSDNYLRVCRIGSVITFVSLYLCTYAFIKLYLSSEIFHEKDYIKKQISLIPEFVVAVITVSLFVMNFPSNNPTHFLNSCISLLLIALFLGLDNKTKSVIFILLSSFLVSSDRYIYFILILPIIIYICFSFNNIKFLKYKILSIVLCIVLSIVIERLFTNLFFFSNMSTKIINADQIFNKFQILIESLLNTYDANFFGKKIISNEFFINLFGLSLLFFSAYSAKKLYKLKLEILLYACMIIIISYFFAEIAYTSIPRYFLGFVIYLNIYPIMYMLNSIPTQPHMYNKSAAYKKIIILFVAFVILVSTIIVINYKFQYPNIYNTVDKISAVIQSRGLKYGISEYWNSHSLTIYSEGKIEIFPIQKNGEKLQNFGYFSHPHMYNKENPIYYFLVNKDSSFDHDFSKEFLEKIFGPISDSEDIDNYIIYFWNEPLNSKLLIFYKDYFDQFVYK